MFQQFTGAVSVAASVPQSTYFLRVIGWNQTTPTASATADIEPIVDESDASFTATPFAMPDYAKQMTSPFTTEHLTVGHTYYIYGPDMQANSPAPYMSLAWTGQVAGSSAHRVGKQISQTYVANTTTPQDYASGSSFWLIPIFDPNFGVIQCYGVFVPVAGQPNYGKLVNSIPYLGGSFVQATSAPGWVTMDEGAVSIKLEG
jgi:hypothetical protein